MLDEDVHFGQLRRCAYKVFRTYVRDNVFTPPAILKHMDMHGGALNSTGIELLQSVELSGILDHGRTLLPSMGVIQECANVMHFFARKVCPFCMIRNIRDGTEGFVFRAANIMVGILLAGGCWDEASMRSIHLAQSINGALFTKNLSHTQGGLKFNDCSNPLKQSRNSVFPIVCVCAKETRGLVHGLFSRVIQEIDKSAKIVIPKKHGKKEITVLTNCDMLCDWTLSGQGGGAKNRTNPCMKCGIRSGELHIATKHKMQCNLCVCLGHTTGPSRVCRHMDMCTEEHLKERKDEIAAFSIAMPEIASKIDDIRAASKLRMDEDPSALPSKVQKWDIKSIHFDIVAASPEQRREFNQFVNHDLQLRCLEIMGTLKARQSRLKQQHIAECTYLLAANLVEQFEASQVANALFLLMDSIPCLLHMER
ncbi:hypothetical protein ACA910_003187 [Epithemia clementina (nom. ined.)]